MISLHSYGSTVVISNRKPVDNTVYPAFSFTVTSEGIATDWIINSMKTNIGQNETIQKQQTAKCFQGN
jgi:hypothetical protein